MFSCSFTIQKLDSCPVSTGALFQHADTNYDNMTKCRHGLTFDPCSLCARHMFCIKNCRRYVFQKPSHTRLFLISNYYAKHNACAYRLSQMLDRLVHGYLTTHLNYIIHSC